MADKIKADKPPVKNEPEAAINRGISVWLDQHLRNTKFSQDTEAWNVLQGALPFLAPTIVKEMK